MRRLILVGVTLLIAFALAQGGPSVDSAGATSQPTSSLSLNTRVAILENRLDRMQTTLDELHTVPSQLATIEDQIRNLSERSRNQGGILQEVGLGIILSTATGLITFNMGKRSK